MFLRFLGAFKGVWVILTNFLGTISIISRWDLEKVGENVGISGKYTLYTPVSFVTLSLLAKNYVSMEKMVTFSPFGHFWIFLLFKRVPRLIKNEG